jgi:hypothetical protein
VADVEKFEFRIKDFTPLTMPMARLSEYLKYLASLFGFESHVHFIMVDEGSANLVKAVDKRAVVRVEKRLLAVENGTARHSAKRAFDKLDDLLYEDNTSATLKTPRGRVVEFPGKDRDLDATAGPILESVTVEGEVIQIGGRDETISVYLRDRADIHICTASREQGKKISKYLFEGKLRVTGTGKFMRSATGEWKMRHFDIADFWPLTVQPLSAALYELQAIDPDTDPTPTLRELMHEG